MERDIAHSTMVSNPLKNNKQVDLVKIEIHSQDGENKIFEFQNIDQAQHFLEEFDFEKVNDS